MSGGVQRGGIASLAALLLVAFLIPAWAVLPDEKLPDARQEARALALSKVLRCVVCQNQNIDESAAPIARDMRLLLRSRIAAGDSDRQAVQFLVSRYGNYVLLDPPFQADTLALWFGPFAVLVVAGVSLAVSLRRRTKSVPAEPLSEEERQRLARVLSDSQPFPGDA